MCLRQDRSHYDNEIKSWHCPEDVFSNGCQGNSHFSANAWCPEYRDDQIIVDGGLDYTKCLWQGLMLQHLIDFGNRIIASELQWTQIGDILIKSESSKYGYLYFVNILTTIFPLCRQSLHLPAVDELTVSCLTHLGCSSRRVTAPGCI